MRDAGQVLKGKVGQYIFISTISVYAANDTPADESAAVAPYKGADPMAETQETLEGQQAGALRPAEGGERGRRRERQFGAAATTIVRPGLIVGPGDETDRFTYWPVRLAARRRGAGARRRDRSGAVHRRPRPGRMDHPHGREPHDRRLQRHRTGAHR